jgi:uncharacterized protein YdcH (DUF465 family)
MAATPKLNVSKLDQDISTLEEPTSTALREALETIHHERTGLLRLKDHIQSRLDTLDEMEAALRSVAPPEAARAVKTTAAPRKRSTSSSKRSSRRSSVPVGDIIEKELQAAGKALSMDDLADRVDKATAGKVDRRGLAGALNGGTRSGRFVKTKGGSYKLPVEATPAS